MIWHLIKPTSLFVSGFTGRVLEDGEQCAENDLLLLDMLEYSLQRADRNLPYKTCFMDYLDKVGGTLIHFRPHLLFQHFSEVHMVIFYSSIKIDFLGKYKQCSHQV